MNGDHEQYALTGIDELVRNLGRPDQDVPPIYLDGVLPDGEGGVTLLDHKDLWIGVGVQPGTFARGSLHPEKRNGQVLLLPSLEQIGAVFAAELLSRNHVWHMFSPLRCSDALVSPPSTSLRSSLTGVTTLVLMRGV